MPLQVKQNLPLLAAKNATISADSLPQISTISVNVMKRELEPRNPGLTFHPTATNKPPTSFAPPPGTVPGTSFVELPEINYDKLPGNPFAVSLTGNQEKQSTTTEKPPYYCNAVLDAKGIPQPWKDKEGTEIQHVVISSSEGKRTLGQATFWYDEKTYSLYIEAKTYSMWE